jgi:tRNA pseudouridine32 synthase / 23S rRNA pseudouridine746 synthase
MFIVIGSLRLWFALDSPKRMTQEAPHPQDMQSHDMPTDMPSDVTGHSLDVDWAREIQARILHRDANVLIIDKPAGMPVHAGPQAATMTGPVLERLFKHLQFGLPRPPALAHRLDRDTSGCLVLGRHRQALARLTELFKAGTVSKTYWAVVAGEPKEDTGLIDLPLGRKDETRGWWMKVDPNGQPSRTRWLVMGRGKDAAGAPLTWLALEPLTGRTHQLRVHCTAMGWPILGDPIYGAGPRFGPVTLHLHARDISLPYAKNKPPLEAVAAPPAHMRTALMACDWQMPVAVSNGSDPELREGM